MKKRDVLKKAAFTLAKEAQAVASVRALLNNGFYKAVELLDRPRGKIVVSGIGKSGQIGAKIASTLISLGISAAYLSPAEAVHGDLGVISLSDAVLGISASGETKELLRVLKHVRKHVGVPIVAITGSPESSLAKVSDAVLVFKIKDEGSPFNLAPMASATATLVIGDMLATALSAKKGFTEKDFAGFHPGGALGLRLTKVKELSTIHKTFPKVSTKERLPEILKTMNRGSLGITAVVSGNGALVGVITDGDIRRQLLMGKLSNSTLAKSLMTRHPKTIREEDSLEDALAKMEMHKITSLFTLDSRKRLIGIVLLHDIVEHKML